MLEVLISTFSFFLEQISLLSISLPLKGNASLLIHYIHSNQSRVCSWDQNMINFVVVLLMYCYFLLFCTFPSLFLTCLLAGLYLTFLPVRKACYLPEFRQLKSYLIEITIFGIYLDSKYCGTKFKGGPQEIRKRGDLNLGGS